MPDDQHLDHPRLVKLPHDSVLRSDLAPENGDRDLPLVEVAEQQTSRSPLSGPK
jgi:hypothetical protein